MKKKRIIALVLCSMFVFSMVASANGTTMTEDMADNILRNNGFTDYMLENIMPDDKIELALTAQTPGTTVEPFMEIVEGNMEKTKDSSTYGMMPSNMMRITVIGGKVSTNSVLQYINCFSTCEWIDYPNITQNDVVTISWGGSDIFKIEENTLEVTNYYKNQITGQWVSYATINQMMDFEIDRYFAYEWNLRGDLCKTYAEFVLKPRNSLTPNGSISIATQYGHKTWALSSVDISVSSPAGVTDLPVLTAGATYTEQIEKLVDYTDVEY